jgi:glycine/D-amino acid oxidase-like deaminating enzyme/nitrite reductase/ring-hydroxylating ferredoxin subunit
METTVLGNALTLDKDESCDVVIVGSGIAGMSAAYELVEAGKDVVVVDRGPIGKGMTSRTTAHLTAQCDDGFEQLIGRRGEEIAKLWYQSQAASINRIEEIQRKLEINCAVRRLPGHLFLAPGTDPNMLDTEYEATKKVGMEVHRQIGVPFRGQENTPSLRYPNQATFHPLMYLSGVASAIREKGGRFYADTVVESVEETGSAVKVKAGNRTIKAKQAVVATNSPINDKYAIHTKQAPYRTYAMAFTLPKGALPDGLYWDTLDAYHYVRLHPQDDNHDALIVGGCDHKSGEANDADVRFQALEVWLRNLVPQLGAELYRWSGQIQDPIDYCGFIGFNPGENRTFIATGDSGQGMTHGVVAGMLIRELILVGESPWREVYDPARKPLSAAGTFISENITALKNFVEYVAPGERSSWDELKPGEGAVVRKGLNKVAAFRDDSGQLHLRSAACTHLGCHVHWNSFERCWDCPCHGSQFAPDGSALNGPAFSSLPEYTE